MPDPTSQIIQAHMAGQQAKRQREAETRTGEEQKLRQKRFEDEQKRLEKDARESFDLQKERLELQKKETLAGLKGTIREQISEGMIRPEGAEYAPPIGEGELAAPAFVRTPTYTDPDTGVSVSDYQLPEQRTALQAAIIDQLREPQTQTIYESELARTAGRMPQIEAEARLRRDLETARAKERSALETQKAEDRYKLQIQRDAEAFRRNEASNLARVKAAELREKAADKRANLDVAEPNRYLKDLEDGIITTDNLSKYIPNIKVRQGVTAAARDKGVKILSQAELDDLSAVRVMNTVISEYERLNKVLASKEVWREGEVRAINETIDQYLAQVSQIVGEQPASRISDKDIELIKGGRPNRKGAIFGNENVTRIKGAKDFIDNKVKEILAGTSSSQFKSLKSRFSFKTYEGGDSTALKFNEQGELME